jgi:hypothetical protein
MTIGFRTWMMRSLPDVPHPSPQPSPRGRGSQIRLAMSTLILTALSLACFARLVADPTALIVDAARPSLDHARTVDDPSVGNDLTRLFLPHHLGISRSIATLGHLPLWDDRGFGGRPLVGNPQAGLFYPPTWIAWLSGVPSGLGWITIGHLILSGVGAYRLARTLGMGGWGSLVAAGCVQASPYVLAQTFEGHYPHVWAACWYPWAFDAAIRVHRGQSRSALALAVILAATFLAGHPQEGYYLLIALGSWTAFDGIVAVFAGRRRDARRLWLAWGIALVLAVGLIGIELIPDAMAQPWCLRGARLPLRLAGRYHVYPINALQLLSPGALGGPADYFGHENYWETVISIGLIPLVLGIVAVAWSTDRRGVRGWLILVAASLVFASGRKLGLFALLYETVPGMDRFRVPARSLFLASLGASMLAGMGVEALRARWQESRSWARLARRFSVCALVLVLMICAGSVIRDSSPDRSTEFDRLRQGCTRLSSDPIFLGASAGTALLLAFGWWRPESRKAVAAALGLLGLVELGIHGHGVIRTTPVDRFLGHDPISEVLLSARPHGLEPPRIRAVDLLYDDLRAGQHGFIKTNVNDSFQIQHAADLYQSLYHLFDDEGRPRELLIASTASRRFAIRQSVLDRMGVALLVADRPFAAWPLVTSGVWNGSSFAVQLNPTALPRAYVVPRVQLASDDASILAKLPESNPREVVLMPYDPLGTDATNRQPFTPAEWVSADTDRVVIRVSTQAPGLLVVADTWMPGWSAEVDGKAQSVLRGNRAQRVIPLPLAGRHEVVLTYHAPGLGFGLALTAASAVVWATLLVANRLRRPFPVG